MIAVPKDFTISERVSELQSLKVQFWTISLISKTAESRITATRSDKYFTQHGSGQKLAWTFTTFT